MRACNLKADVAGKTARVRRIHKKKLHVKITYMRKYSKFYFVYTSKSLSREKRAEKKGREGQEKERKQRKDRANTTKYGTSQLEQQPYSRGKRESVPQTRLFDFQK